jgi:hypothetical protein
MQAAAVMASAMASRYVVSLKNRVMFVHRMQVNELQLFSIAGTVAISGVAGAQERPASEPGVITDRGGRLPARPVTQEITGYQPDTSVPRS